MRLDYSKKLLPESAAIYRKHAKRLLLLLALVMITYAVTYWFYFANDIQNMNDTRVTVFLNVVCLIFAGYMLYVLFRGETFWQLRRRDIAKGKSDAREILKSMKGMGHGKK